jgi:hypothetical protein
MHYTQLHSQSQCDALGAARGNASGGDESASIINELLVQVGGRLTNLIITLCLDCQYQPTPRLPVSCVSF